MDGSALTLIGERNLFTTDPYIRNATAKLYWNPSPNVNWTLDANLDTDGVALAVNNINLHLYEEETLVSSALKVLMGKDLLWNLMVSYNTFNTDSGFEAPDRYNTEYSQNVTNTDFSTQDEYRYQVRTELRLDADGEPGDQLRSGRAAGKLVSKRNGQLLPLRKPRQL